MKKFIFSLVVMLATVFSANAQNYAGSSKFTDNWSVTLQGGVVTPFNDFFQNGSVTPIVVLGADKYVNPWLGFGVDARTSIGTGDSYNLHTAFDVVNVSGVAKLNIVNLFDFDGTRKVFEPVLYTGLGWGHNACSNCPSLSQNYSVVNGVPTEKLGTNMRNYVTYRAGMELNFNLGKTRAWGIVVNPSVVWGNIDNGRLCKANGNFEVTAGVVYHFKTSNKTHAFTKAHLYDQAEVDALNAKISELEKRPTVVNNVTQVVADKIVYKESKYAVSFDWNSSVLSDAAKETLNSIPAGSNVTVAGSTSPEGTSQRNEVLAQERADVVANYLKERGVNVTSAVGGSAGRAAVITVEK